MMATRKQESGFTLIELSIVLVIIGLIVGGVLVGQDLIKAAEVRAQISQIEKYNTAVNTFRVKYNALPGDIADPAATQFGFLPRGGQGDGDGNGVIETSGGYGLGGGDGEELMFWVDLSTAHLIEGGFSTATPSTVPGPTVAGALVNSYLPQAKIGNGNYIYVFSGGWGNNSGSASDGINYYGLSAVTSLGQSNCNNCLISNVGLTVQQAYSIDKKIDDGQPTTGNVLAAYISSNNWYWPNINANIPPPTQAEAPSNSTCFDNGGNSSNSMQYSIAYQNGANVTCGLTFRFQ